MSLRHVLTALFGSFAIALAAVPAWAEPPRVLTTIKPLQSLAAGVMAGVAQPHLLLRATASAHNYALRPSDVQALQKADVVLWIGPEYEAFMAKAARSLPKRAAVIEAARIKGVALWPTREGGLWESHEDAGGGSHGHAHRGEHGHDDHGEQDMHLWLDPANAKLIASALATALGRRDEANAGRYAANAAALSARIDTLDKELVAKLAPVKDKLFVVFHDAYQYFEKRYGLASAGSITVTPDRVPGPRRISELRRTITERNAVCVFSEPQFTPTLVGTVLEGTNARGGVLDPLGAAAPEGPDGYFGLMHGIADSLKACLLPAS